MTRDDLLALRLLAENFEDIQRVRIATENRVRSGQIDAAVTAPILEALRRAERLDGAAMRKEFRHVVPASLRRWQSTTLGIGEHLLARLLAVIGDPAVAYPHHWESANDLAKSTVPPPSPSRGGDRATFEIHDGLVASPAGEGAQGSSEIQTMSGDPPHRLLVPDAPYARSLHQLWQYCGHGDPTRRRKAGMDQKQALGLGNPRAKMLVHLLAEACMKQRRSPYRRVYDDARAASADHEGWSLLHQHNDALRRVGKEILRDLWKVAAEGREEVAA